MTTPEDAITTDDLARAELLIAQERQRREARATIEFRHWLEIMRVELKVSAVLLDDGRIGTKAWFVAV